MNKILIVDDQPEIRELVKVTLELGNYRIYTAENGQQAMLVAQAERPDIVLLDVKMPGSSITGLEVCRRLKNDPATAHAYIVIISASGQQYDLVMAKAMGADDYLIKPFSPFALFEKIEVILQRRPQKIIFD
ncbi:MAG: response regulator [Chloroflexota bacterium]